MTGHDNGCLDGVTEHDRVGSGTRLCNRVFSSRGWVRTVVGAEKARRVTPVIFDL